MQKQIDRVKDKVVQFLQEQNIKFQIDETLLQRDGSDETRTGYKIFTEAFSSFIAWNFKSRKVEFLVLNENLIQHLVSEGMTDEQIMENGKVWIHLKTLASYKKMFSLLAVESN